MYGLRGMGVLDYYGLLAQANLQDCSPLDSTCVSNNVAKQAAVEDFWAAHQGGVPDDTKLTFTPQTQAQVTEFYNPTNYVSGGNVVDTRGIMQVAVPSQNIPPTPVAPAAPVSQYGTCGDPPQIRTSMVAGVPVVNSSDVSALAAWSKCTGIKSTIPALPASSQAPAKSAAATPTPTQSSVPSDYTATFAMPDFSQGFSFSTVPWWMWAGGAAVALFAFGGGRGR